MDNISLDMYAFFYPSRLGWENWQKFNGERKKPSDSTDYTMPQAIITHSATEPLVGTIADYFGIPINVTQGTHTMSVNRIPFTAYDEIYNEWFRDQNLINSKDIVTSDIPVDHRNFGDNGFPHRVAKYSDYFTRALPFPQKGMAVELPIGGLAPVVGTISAHPNQQHLWDQNGPSNISLITNQNIVDKPYLALTNSGAAFVRGRNADNVGNQVLERYLMPHAPYSHTFNLSANLQNATAITINALREAVQLQRLFERDARGGTRYTEILRSHFGVISPDARLQRPEFLGQGRQAMHSHIVPQTSQTQATPLGTLASYATFADDSALRFKKSFTEHGYIIILGTVRSNESYQQGLDRMWTRKTRFDFFIPVLQHLGEQEILGKEIFYNGTSSDDSVFGYAPRYEEYKFNRNKITGKLRSIPWWANNANTPWQSLDVWHMAQRFTQRPELNKAFIEANTPIARSLALDPLVSGEPPVIYDSRTTLYVTRVMDTYAMPGKMDHF
jgi:hypothetical protein